MDLVMLPARSRQWLSSSSCRIPKLIKYRGIIMIKTGKEDARKIKMDLMMFPARSMQWLSSPSCRIPKLTNKKYG